MTLLADIATVRSWINKQQHFPEEIDDHLIERFLACCDGSLERTKTAMGKFFCLRADAPEFFYDRDPLHPKMQEVFALIHRQWEDLHKGLLVRDQLHNNNWEICLYDLLPLPNLTPEGFKVFIYKVADPDPEKFVFNEYVKNFFLVGDTRVKTETVIPRGEVVIFDMRGYSVSHLLRLPLISLRKYMQYTQEAHPVRLRQIHVINVSPLLDKTLVLVKPFMKSEVAGMLHFHQPGSTSLHEFVPLDILPKEYGGKAGPIADIKETWKARVEKNRDWFLTNPWLANNSKRGDKKHQLNFMEGSFRTLTID